MAHDSIRRIGLKIRSCRLSGSTCLAAAAFVLGCRLFRQLQKPESTTTQRKRPNMKETSRDAIRTALVSLLSDYRSAEVPQEQHWEHRKQGSAWSGKQVPKPSARGLAILHRDAINRLAVPLQTTLESDYPDHVLGLGTSIGVGRLQAHDLLPRLAYEYLERYETLSPSDSHLDKLLNELAELFDKPTVRLRIFAPVLNLTGRGDVRPIDLFEGFILRLITDREVTRFYSAPFHQLPLNMPDFVLVREIEVPKVIGSKIITQPDNAIKQNQELIDRCILALASFKDCGPVGIDGLRIEPVTFTTAIGFNMSFLRSENLFGEKCELSSEEAPKLEIHARHFKNIHPSMEMACQRLVDSTRRAKVHDAIVDAVIGMESILLYGTQRSELSFRFSLNYAYLFDASERADAFKVARDLYNLRSRVAHGGSPNSTHEIGGQKMTPQQAAVVARSVLRRTLQHFMCHSDNPEFLQKEYWLSRVLGL